MKIDNHEESNQNFKIVIDDRDNKDMSLSADCFLNISINLLMMNKEGEFQNILENTDSALDHLALFLQQDVELTENSIF